LIEIRRVFYDTTDARPERMHSGRVECWFGAEVDWFAAESRIPDATNVGLGQRGSTI
jgi:hypothetical protein